MTLQPPLDPGLSEMAPPFFSDSSFSPPTSCSMCQKLCPLPYTQIFFYLPDPADSSLRFCLHKLFYGVRLVSRPTPDWKTITFDASGMGDRTSSYATASIALRIILPPKPHNNVKVGIPSVFENWSVCSNFSVRPRYKMP